MQQRIKSTAQCSSNFNRIRDKSIIDGAIIQFHHNGDVMELWDRTLHFVKVRIHNVKEKSYSYRWTTTLECMKAFCEMLKHEMASDVLDCIEQSNLGKYKVDERFVALVTSKYHELDNLRRAIAETKKSINAKVLIIKENAESLSAEEIDEEINPILNNNQGLNNVDYYNALVILDDRLTPKPKPKAVTKGISSMARKWAITKKVQDHYDWIKLCTSENFNLEKLKKVFQIDKPRLLEFMGLEIVRLNIYRNIHTLQPKMVEKYHDMIDLNEDNPEALAWVQEQVVKSKLENPLVIKHLIGFTNDLKIKDKQLSKCLMLVNKFCGISGLILLHKFMKSIKGGGDTRLIVLGLLEQRINIEIELLDMAKITKSGSYFDWYLRGFDVYNFNLSRYELKQSSLTNAAKNRWAVKYEAQRVSLVEHEQVLSKMRDYITPNVPSRYSAQLVKWERLVLKHYSFVNDQLYSEKLAEMKGRPIVYIKPVEVPDIATNGFYHFTKGFAIKPKFAESGNLVIAIKEYHRKDKVWFTTDKIVVHPSIKISHALDKKVNQPRLRSKIMKALREWISETAELKEVKKPSKRLIRECKKMYKPDEALLDLTEELISKANIGPLRRINLFTK